MSFNSGGRGSFRLISHNEDSVVTAKGSLIPDPPKGRSFPGGTFKLSPLPSFALLRVVATSVGVFLLSVAVSSAGLSAFGNVQLASAPAILVIDPELGSPSPLNYGVNLALSQPDFYLETRNTLINQEQTFIEADLSGMVIRYFEEGVLLLSAPILAKGREGSWWETPSGLYKIDAKKENHFSSIGQVFQPWSMVFQGNFFIHGWPHYPDGTMVASSFSGGCIRLSDDDAKKFYDLVKIDTPVLVHELEEEPDHFLYEPRIPEIDTPNYLIADIESSTVLASSDLHNRVPIASVTKLMTALVAAEYINLDKKVRANQPTFVQSLVPRLGSRSTVSMYSLLQLLLVESSNEAAEVIASQVGREKFIEYMNEKAIAIGMTSSTFTDPSGLDDGNISTLHDLLRLAQYINENRSFILELTANQDLPTAYVSGEFGELLNFNEVEGLDNFIGGKVGETAAAGQTSLTIHHLKVRGEDRKLAIILLGSDSRNEDVTELMNYAEERFGD